MACDKIHSQFGAFVNHEDYKLDGSIYSYFNFSKRSTERLVKSDTMGIIQVCSALAVDKMRALDLLSTLLHVHTDAPSCSTFVFRLLISSFCSKYTTCLINFNQLQTSSSTTKLLCSIFSKYNFHFSFLPPINYHNDNNSFCKISAKHCVFIE
jgi:hypothetical protein